MQSCSVKPFSYGHHHSFSTNYPVPSCLRARGTIHSKLIAQFRSSISGLTHRDRLPFKLILTPTGNLESPINLSMNMFLDSLRKPEWQENILKKPPLMWLTEKPQICYIKHKHGNQSAFIMYNWSVVVLTSFKF